MFARMGSVFLKLFFLHSAYCTSNFPGKGAGTAINSSDDYGFIGLNRLRETCTTVLPELLR